MKKFSYSTNSWGDSEWKIIPTASNFQYCNCTGNFAKDLARGKCSHCKKDIKKT